MVSFKVGAFWFSRSSRLHSYIAPIKKPPEGGLVILHHALCVSMIGSENTKNSYYQSHESVLDD